MKPRDQKILWGVGGLVGLYIGWGLFDGWFLAPLRELDNQIEARALVQSNKERDITKQLLAARRLETARATSLPPDRAEAKRLYLKWLTALVQSCGIRPEKAPEARGERPDGTTLVAFPIEVEGTATYDQAMLFLKRFSEVNLLQRMSQFSLEVVQPGNPQMKLKFTAEGVSMPDARPRPTLFTETSLADAVTAKATTLSVADGKAFPLKAPFMVQMGQERVEVTAVDGNTWTITRGHDGTTAASHVNGSVVELIPLRTPGQNEPTSSAIHEKLLASNPFMKPQPVRQYRPRLSPSGNQLLTKGQPLSLTIKAEGWNPGAGNPVFAVEGELPAGLTLDGKTGAVMWNPAKDFPPGEYKLSVVATGDHDPMFKATTNITIRVRDANQAPVLASVKPDVAYLGRPWTLQFTATDPDPKDKLTYSLSGTVPMGATVDASTGKVTWTPSEDGDPVETTLTVQVTDSGDPPMSTSQTVSIKVEDDAARFTRLTGVVTLDDVQEVWFFDPSINKTTRVKLGGPFRFADIQGTVTEVVGNGDYVVLTVDGRKMRLDSGKTMRDLKPLDGEPAAAATTPTATPPTSPQPAPTDKPATTDKPADAPGAAPTPAAPQTPAPTTEKPSASDSENSGEPKEAEDNETSEEPDESEAPSVEP